MGKLKKLFWDTETSPNTAYIWGMFKQNVSLSQLVDTSRLLCVCAKWEGSSKVIRLAEWEYQERLDFLMDVWQLLDDADAVVSYNGTRFDTPVINKEFLLQGITPPSPSIEIDVYQTVKHRFRFTSGKLDHLVQELGLGKKDDTGGFQLWVDVLNGVPKAQKKMIKYCANDVKILEKLYYEVLPWIKRHPNVALVEADGVHRCPNCGGDSLEKRGFYYTKVNAFQRYVCNTCGAWSRERLADKRDRSGILTNI